MSPSLIYWSVSFSVNLFKVQFSHLHLKFCRSKKDYCILKLKYNKIALSSSVTFIPVVCLIEALPAHIASQVKSGNELDTSIQCTWLVLSRLSLHTLGLWPTSPMSNLQVFVAVSSGSWRSHETGNSHDKTGNCSTVSHPSTGGRQAPNIWKETLKTTSNVGLMQDAQRPSYCDDEEWSSSWLLIRVNDCAKPVI